MGVHHDRRAVLRPRVPVLVRRCDPVPDRPLGRPLEVRIDGQREAAARDAPPQGPQRPDGPPERVDGDAVALEAAVQEPVVLPLDARLADHLAGPRASELGLLQLIRPDLPQEPEELGSEPSLRIAPHRQRGDVQAREGDRALVEEVRQPALQVREDDSGRVRRAHATTADSPHERGEVGVREPGDPHEQASPVAGRHPSTVGGGAAERLRVCGQHEPTRRSREHHAPRVDDRGARRGQVDVAEGLPLCKVRIAGALEHLERPEPEREDPEGGKRDRGQHPDTDVEAGAAEEPRVRRGDRLGDRAPARKGPRQAAGATPLRRGRRDHRITTGRRKAAIALQRREVRGKPRDCTLPAGAQALSPRSHSEKRSPAAATFSPVSRKIVRKRSE